MPAVSAKQYGLMQAIAHGAKSGLGAPSGGGPSQAVAKEFVAKTPAIKRHRFAKALAKK